MSLYLKKNGHIATYKYNHTETNVGKYYLIHSDKTQ